MRVIGNIEKLRRRLESQYQLSTSIRATFTNSSVDSTTVLELEFPDSFPANPSQELHKPMVHGCCLKSAHFGVQVIPQLQRAQFLRTMTHYNTNSDLNCNTYLDLIQLLHQNVHRLEYFECCEVRPIQLQRRADLKSFSHYLQLVFEIYL
ncbi:Hypothetical_protein [Hexamita inflata]|uniref:Hypothetical_protein n=1 Tax=Hexamita inflata TaxID=28002 RepID=A0AA86QZ05_9EUKA|nr:Hypothetical protein HINF_LOCUS49929 [Hexamita inflata]